MHLPESGGLPALLARLLSDGDELHDFLNDRQAWLAGNDADQDCIACLSTVPRESLISQRSTLIKKRWHAVRQLIPESSFANQSIDNAMFRLHADQYWPEGHRRHELDALHFLRFCQSRGVSVSAVEIARLELQLGLRRFRLLGVRLHRRGRLRPALLLMKSAAGRSCRELLIASL